MEQKFLRGSRRRAILRGALAATGVAVTELPIPVQAASCTVPDISFTTRAFRDNAPRNGRPDLPQEDLNRTFPGTNLIIKASGNSQEISTTLTRTFSDPITLTGDCANGLLGMEVISQYSDGYLQRSNFLVPQSGVAQVTVWREEATLRQPVVPTVVVPAPQPVPARPPVIEYPVQPAPSGPQIIVIPAPSPAIIERPVPAPPPPQNNESWISPSTAFLLGGALVGGLVAWWMHGHRRREVFHLDPDADYIDPEGNRRPILPVEGDGVARAAVIQHADIIVRPINLAEVPPDPIVPPPPPAP